MLQIIFRAIVPVLLVLSTFINAWGWFPRLIDDSYFDPTITAPLVGDNKPYIVSKGDTLIDLAYRSSIGYQSLVNANPGVDPWSPPVGKEVVLPYSALLPMGMKPGITVNLAEFRLYYRWEQDGRDRVRVYAIGIGQEDWNTPLGTFHIAVKVKDPAWTVLPALREANPSLPKVIPPGPSNPLGQYWLGLDRQGVGIHGTNRPYGVGRQVSHGCIRLYPADIANLFQIVPKGTAVTIIDQPIKAGVYQGNLYVEVHPDPRNRCNDPRAELQRQLQALGWKGPVDWDAFAAAWAAPTGLPIVISNKGPAVADSHPK